ncbi:DASH family cryptochrome [uncultured Methylophaga sp.]|uniref:DASH family cryptochrome n=1 Tax=uncultured Methylophaga sp. TaxID=285271 RepID=UPI002636618C|nr:DASH family cryptochrome [uncultured Methylophaga sp.]
MKQTGLIWFNNDLRVHDNPALLEASLHCQRLICLFCYDSHWFKPTGLNARPLGDTRHRFLNQSLMDLSDQLARRGQSLIVVSGEPVAVISDLIRRFKVEALYRSDHVGVYENRQWQHLKADFPRLEFVSLSSHTLFRPEQLPFTLTSLPESFSRFRRQVEALDIDPPLMMPKQLSAPVEALTEESQGFAISDAEQSLFEGGERAALAQLEAYFSSDRPAHYKHWRNELDGWSNSTKFSPWLANGNLSVRRLLKRLRDFEQEQVANESTYWIFFELLWREYFQWVARKLGHKLFSAQGVAKNKKQCCFYPERYQKWCHGNTPYPLVNALMNQLNQTGYMSNRGRQIVASCLVNELQLDWRFGAAYFEQQLIDYDVASNWGNWQYIAGVGMDPRGGRHFNIDKQTRQFDPEGRFIRDWQGEVTAPQLDSVDAADWPILPGKPTQ